MKKMLLTAAAMFAGVLAFAQAQFAHVNFQELVQLMPEADQARATIAASSKEAQDTYQTMVEEFNKKYADYEKNTASWSAATRKTKEDELTDLQKRIQQFSQSIQQELAEQQDQLMAPIYKKAQEVIQDLAKKAGCVYVFDKTSVLYIDEAQSKDLTAEARTALGIPADRTMESLQAELQAQAQAQQQ